MESLNWMHQKPKLDWLFVSCLLFNQSLAKHFYCLYSPHLHYQLGLRIVYWCWANLL